MLKLKRNDLCDCGSGRKYKKCCINFCLEPDSASNVIDFSWSRIREVDEKLSKILFAYFENHYPDKFNILYEQFYCFKDQEDAANLEEESDSMFFCAFIPWLLYNCTCQDFDISQGEDSFSGKTIAESYLIRYGYTLTKYEQDLIRANLKAHFSFYEVLKVNPGKSIKLRDILRNIEIVVQERMGSQDLETGMVFLAKVTTLDECSIMSASFPQVLPPNFISTLIEFKQSLSKKDFTDKELVKYDFEIRDLYFNGLEYFSYPPLSSLMNTDGDEIILSRVEFDLKCTVQEAFDRLCALAKGIPKQEILETATYGGHSASDELTEIELPWLVKGNKKIKCFEHTILAEIRIKSQKIIAEVNSSRRAKKIKKEIELLMGDMAKYKITTYESLDKKVDPSNISDIKSERNIRDINGIQILNNKDNQELYSNDLSQEEIKAIVKEMHDKHWREWIKSKIPALGNKTPIDAAKTKFGRERLESLFSMFHQQNLRNMESDPDFPLIDLEFLRKALKMQ